MCDLPVSQQLKGKQIPMDDELGVYGWSRLSNNIHKNRINGTCRFTVRRDQSTASQERSEGKNTMHAYPSERQGMKLMRTTLKTMCARKIACLFCTRGASSGGPCISCFACRELQHVSTRYQTMAPKKPSLSLG